MRKFAVIAALAVVALMSAGLNAATDVRPGSSSSDGWDESGYHLSLANVVAVARTVRDAVAGGEG